MNNSTIRTLIIAVIILAVISTVSVTKLLSGGAGGGGVSTSEVEEIVYEYLKNNPSAIIQAFEQGRAEQEAKEVAAAAENIGAKRDELENNPTTPYAGNKDGDVVIVEFFDYNCGYCKRVVPDLAKILAEDKGVKIVLKDFPILSEQSRSLAKAALAVNNIARDKFWAFHTKIMQQTPRNDEQLFAKALELGIDVEKLKAEIEKPEYDNKLQENLQLGGEVGVRGTPGFIINGELIRGAIGLNDFRKKIEEARS